MRYCFNDVPDVYEASNVHLDVLLEEVAEQIRAIGDESSTFNLVVGSWRNESESLEYLATLYAH